VVDHPNQSTEVIKPTHECVEVIKHSVGCDQFPSGYVVDVAPIARCGVDRFNKPKIFTFKRTQCGAMGTRAFTDVFDFVEGFTKGVTYFAVGVPIDCVINVIVKVIVKFLH
jgi:hypothetical protein